jgi:hypothetical protein
VLVIQDAYTFGWVNCQVQDSGSSSMS